ncbi:MAG TPA: peptide ABC transporter substrate-binding protein [Candidatus Baltobacteraceae bacterium]|nr:peptide ABC transporter substrate-binding protein [Candidatus Baltobacteraceae bacterium]
MRTLTLSLSKGALLIAALAVLCSGCSKSGAPGAAPPSNGVLRVGLWAEPNSLNPLLASNTAEDFIAALAFSMLVTIDNHGRDVPDLAAAVPTLENGGISKDGLTITYHLRRNVKWQDGAPFTSADVKFSWQAVMNPDNNVVERRGYDQVQSVDTPDPYTVVFHLKRPFAPFVDTVFGESDDPYRVIPRHLLARYKNINQVPFNQLPIGTGPFKVTRWIHGDRIEYVANPYYFLGKPKLRAITVYIVPDSNTAEAELRAHNLDLVPDVATANLSNLRERPAPGVTTMLVPGPVYSAIQFNLTHPPLDDVRVRRALSYGIDEKRIIDTLLYGSGVPATADLADFYWAYDGNVTRYPYDPAKARAMLDSAGWLVGPGGIRRKNGRALSLQLVYGQGNATARQMGVQIQSDLRKIGVDVSVKDYTYTMLYATQALGGILDGGKFDLAEYLWVAGADPDDSDGWMCDAAPPAGNNVAHYCNPQFDAAERDALTHVDRTRRKSDYAKTQALLASDAPAAFQYYQRLRYALSTNVQNFRPNGVTASWNAYEWSL